MSDSGCVHREPDKPETCHQHEDLSRVALNAAKQDITQPKTVPQFAALNQRKSSGVNVGYHATLCVVLSEALEAEEALIGGSNEAGT